MHLYLLTHIIFNNNRYIHVIEGKQYLRIYCLFNQLATSPIASTTNCLKCLKCSRCYASRRIVIICPFVFSQHIDVTDRNHKHPRTRFIITPVISSTYPCSRFWTPQCSFSQLRRLLCGLLPTVNSSSILQHEGERHHGMRCNALTRREVRKAAHNMSL